MNFKQLLLAIDIKDFWNRYTLAIPMAAGLCLLARHDELYRHKRFGGFNRAMQPIWPICSSMGFYWFPPSITSSMVKLPRGFLMAGF